MRPLPKLAALRSRGRVWVVVVGNAGFMLSAPRPTARRALSVMGRSRNSGWASDRETAVLLAIPTKE